MKITKSLGTALLILFTLFTTACDKDETSNDSIIKEAEQYIGEYQLNEVFWSGLAIDLDNNGIGRHDLLWKEMGVLLGYYPLNHTAKMEMAPVAAESDEGPIMFLFAQLPYPVYMRTSKGIEAQKIDYLPVSLNIFHYSEFDSQSIFPKFGESSTEDFLAGIKEITTSKVTPQEIEIRVRCTMYDMNQTKDLDYLHYIFKRK